MVAIRSSPTTLSLLLLFRLCHHQPTVCADSSVIRRPDDQRIIHPTPSAVVQQWPSLDAGDRAAERVPVMSIKSRGFLVGDFCDDADQCNPGLPHTVCNAMTQRCECDPAFPIVVDNSICVPPLKLGEDCLYDQSCQYYDRNAVCASAAEGGNECRCRAAFHPSITLESISRTSICIPEPHGPWLKSDVPTVIGLGVGMSIFMALTCLVLKLFSRARFAQEQARGYGNAHLAPPTHSATNNTHSDGKHPASRHNYHRQVSITDSEAMGAPPSGRRQSSQSTTYETTRSPMRNHRGDNRESFRDSTGGAHHDTEKSTPSMEQLHPLQP